MEVIVPNKNHENHLMYLLQDIYFDNIDTAKADEASEAMPVSYTHLTLPTKA